MVLESIKVVVVVDSLGYHIFSLSMVYISMFSDFTYTEGCLTLSVTIGY